MVHISANPATLMTEQFTVTIFDSGQIPIHEFITSKPTCVVGNSLACDIRIHLPSIEETHMIIDIANRTVSSYGNDVVVGDLAVGTNERAVFKYGDSIMLKGKRFVVRKNETIKEESVEGVEIRQLSSSRTDSPGRCSAGPEEVENADGAGRLKFNASPTKPKRSVFFCDTSSDAPVVARDSGSQKEATSSSVDSATIISKEKQIVNEEIKQCVEPDVNPNISVEVKSAGKPDLVRCVVEKKALREMGENLSRNENVSVIGDILEGVEKFESGSAKGEKEEDEADTAGENGDECADGVEAENVNDLEKCVGARSEGSPVVDVTVDGKVEEGKEKKENGTKGESSETKMSEKKGSEKGKSEKGKSKKRLEGGETEGSKSDKAESGGMKTKEAKKRRPEEDEPRSKRKGEGDVSREKKRRKKEREEGEHDGDVELKNVKSKSDGVVEGTANMDDGHVKSTRETKKGRKAKEASAEAPRRASTKANSNEKGKEKKSGKDEKRKSAVSTKGIKKDTRKVQTKVSLNSLGSKPVRSDASKSSSDGLKRLKRASTTGVSDESKNLDNAKGDEKKKGKSTKKSKAGTTDVSVSMKGRETKKKEGGLSKKKGSTTEVSEKTRSSGAAKLTGSTKASKTSADGPESSSVPTKSRGKPSKDLNGIATPSTKKSTRSAGATAKKATQSASSKDTKRKK